MLEHRSDDANLKRATVAVIAAFYDVSEYNVDVEQALVEVMDASSIPQVQKALDQINQALEVDMSEPATLEGCIQSLKHLANG